MTENLEQLPEEQPLDNEEASYPVDSLAYKIDAVFKHLRDVEKSVEQLRVKRVLSYVTLSEAMNYGLS